MSQNDILQKLAEAGDQAAFYLRDIAAGTNPGGVSIAEVAADLQAAVEVAMTSLITTEFKSERTRRYEALVNQRELAGRTDRDGIAYATQYDLRKAHRLKRQSNDDPYHRLAVANAEKAELEVERMRKGTLP